MIIIRLNYVRLLKSKNSILNIKLLKFSNFRTVHFIYGYELLSIKPNPFD